MNWLQSIKDLFMSGTSYEYTETETKISAGKIEIKRVKKTGESAKAEFDKASEDIKNRMKEFHL